MLQIIITAKGRCHKLAEGGGTRKMGGVSTKVRKNGGGVESEVQKWGGCGV